MEKLCPYRDTCPIRTPSCELEFILNEWCVEKLIKRYDVLYNTLRSIHDLYAEAGIVILECVDASRSVKLKQGQLYFGMPSGAGKSHERYRILTASGVNVGTYSRWRFELWKGANLL